MSGIQEAATLALKMQNSHSGRIRDQVIAELHIRRYLGYLYNAGYGDWSVSELLCENVTPVKPAA